jgi:5-(carboxyamino)imidazole ribonucleotide synthase
VSASRSDHAGAILPGATIGIVGGGQLGLMTALAARPLGYRVWVLDPERECPAAGAADRHIAARYDDAQALEELARGCDVVTFEFENVPASGLERLAQLVPVRPSPAVLATCRHRELEKNFLAKSGFPVVAHRFASSAQELEEAAEALGTPAVAKAVELGYDGKGQSRVESPDDARRVFDAIGAPRVVLERFVPFDAELSVVTARGPDGSHATFPITRNDHAKHVLDVTCAPSGFSADVERRARAMAIAIAEALDVVGLVTVEMFLVGEDLIVNELAPRPHNSGHHTLESCVTSQFEQHVRAVCGLPLGDTSLRSPAAMVNLLGDLWSSGEPDWTRVLATPNAHLHLYGKRVARPGRKMGHVTVLDADAARAVRIARELRASLAPHVSRTK